MAPANADASDGYRVSLKAFASPQHRCVTLIFLTVFCLAANGTFAIGLEANTAALVMAYVATTALVLAFVHPWRRVREFKYLVYGSGLGFALFVLLHNLLDAGAVAMASVWPLHAILQGVGVAAFLVALFVCPPALLIGLGGALIMFLRDRRRGQPEPAA